MLTGRTALVVEEEFLIALDLQRMLEALGITQTLFARNAAEAGQLSARWPEIAIAVVEIHSDNEQSIALAGSLVESGIPTVLVTADAGPIPCPMPQPCPPVVTKPVPDLTLAEAVRQAMAARRQE